MEAVTVYYMMVLVCSYCDSGAMECKPERINASTVAVNVSRKTG
jgi:hypothetical protein